MEYADFGSDDDFLRGRLAGELAHSASGEPFVRSVAYVVRTFGVDHNGSAGMGGPRIGYGLCRKRGVSRAVARPEDVLSPEEPHYVRAEVLVWNEDYLVVWRELRHYALCVARSDADVAFGLHLRGGIHVADCLCAWMLRLELAKLRARYHVCHRAAGGRVGNENGLLWIQDSRRLGHEVDAAENYHVGVHLRGAPRELERVAGEVCGVLHLGTAVVVREYYRVAAFL